MASLAERIYFASPIPVQQGLVAGYGWWWFRRRFGREFHRWLPELTARERWSREAWREHQRQALGDLFRAAWNAPFHRPRLEAAGYTAEADPWEVFARLPLLTKEDLRAHGRELLTREPPRGTAVFRSSGTTGTPTEIYYEHDFHQVVQAYFEVRNRQWAGVTYRSRRAMFGVRKVCRPGQDRPPFWRRSPAEKLTYFSIYHLSPQHLPHYLDALNRLRPEVVVGYPNSLVTVARFALETGVRLAAPRAIITTSETVMAAIRRDLEGAWGCRVFDQYGAVEGCVLASQCDEGSYHVSPDVGIVEILRPDGTPAPPGEVGEVVVTGLLNRLQPLIRYRIGDVAAWAKEQACACGREMPILRGIEGRLEDLCVTRDGRQLLRFDTVFKGVEAIREGQIVQESLDRFLIRVVPTAAFSERDRERLRHNMALHVEGVDVEVVLLDAIPRTASGKFRPVISRVKPEGKA